MLVIKNYDRDMFALVTYLYWFIYSYFWSEGKRFLSSFISTTRRRSPFIIIHTAALSRIKFLSNITTDFIDFIDPLLKYVPRGTAFN